MPQTMKQSVGVTLDSNGNGQVDLYPRSTSDWVIVGTTVSVSSAVKQPTARFYKNGVNDSNFFGGTYTGANDTAGDRTLLHQGESLSCVWAGGDAGARATMVCSIVQYEPGEAPVE